MPESLRVLILGHVRAYVGPMLGQKNSKRKKKTLGIYVWAFWGPCWAIFGVVRAYLGPCWSFCWPLLGLSINSNRIIFGWNWILGHVGAFVGSFWGCQGLSWAIWRVLLFVLFVVWKFPVCKLEVWLLNSFEVCFKVEVSKVERSRSVTWKFDFWILVSNLGCWMGQTFVTQNFGANVSKPSLNEITVCSCCFCCLYLGILGKKGREQLGEKKHTEMNTKNFHFEIIVNNPSLI